MVVALLHGCVHGTGPRVAVGVGAAATTVGSLMAVWGQVSPDICSVEEPAGSCDEADSFSRTGLLVALTGAALIVGGVIWSKTTQSD